jgi:phosphatidylserine synthase
MNWKKFLKPDWRKIVIFVILFVIGFITFLISSSFGVRVIPDSATEVLIAIFLPTIFITQFLGSSNIGFILILTMVYWYILSCLIVWIYDRFRKVKKK